MLLLEPLVAPAAEMQMNTKRKQHTYKVQLRLSRHRTNKPNPPFPHLGVCVHWTWQSLVQQCTLVASHGVKGWCIHQQWRVCQCLKLCGTQLVSETSHTQRPHMHQSLQHNKQRQPPTTTTTISRLHGRQ